MGSLSNYAELELLDHVFNAAYSPVATVYVAFCTADPTEAGTGASMNEAANSNAYARAAISFSAASSRQIVQNGQVNFPQASGAWGSLTHFAIVDSATYGAGNMLAYGALASTRVPIANDTPFLANGEVVISLDAGEISNYLVHKLLDLMFRNQAYSAPDTYVGITTATVGDTDTGSTITEPSGSGYGREQVNPNGGSSPTWTIAASGALANNNTVTLGPPSGGDWGACTSMVICDAATAGNLLFYDNDMANATIEDGDTVQFPAGDIDVTLN